MFHNLYSSAVVCVHLTAATVIWRNIPFAFTAKQRPRIQQVNQLEGSANIRIFTDSKYFWMKTPMVLVLGYMVGYCCSASLTDFLCISLPAFCGKVESTWSAGAASLTPEHKGSRLTLELKNAVAVSQRNFKGLLQHSMHKSQIFATAWDLNC